MSATRKNLDKYLDLVEANLDSSLDYETRAEMEGGNRYLVIECEDPIMEEVASIGNDLDSRVVSNNKGSRDFRILLE